MVDLFVKIIYGVAYEPQDLWGGGRCLAKIIDLGLVMLIMLVMFKEKISTKLSSRVIFQNNFDKVIY